MRQVVEMNSILTDDEIENTTSKAAKASNGTHWCGYPIDRTHLCYPSAKSKISGIRSAKAACTASCTGVQSMSSKVMSKVIEGMSKGFECKCPNKGESCRSAFDKDPGMMRITNGVISSYTAVKVEIGTGKWQFLKSEETWKGNDKVITWDWASPEPEGTGDSWSPMHEDNGPTYKKGDPMVVPPSESELIKTLGADNVPGNPDFCDPALAAKYLLAVKANPSRL